MTNSPLLASSRPTRRHVLKSAALGSVAAIAAPYVKDSYAAGSLSLGVWDHWVPGANKTLTKLCNEWGAKNNCEVTIDYITSQGEKDKLTAAAEAQAGTGHDIMSHRDWNIRIHQNVLEPLDDVVGAAHQAIRPDQPGRRISRQDQRHLARRADDGRQPGQAVLLALRSLSAACRHRRARHVPRRRVEMGPGEDRQLELGYLSHVRAKTLQGRLPGRLADGPDERRGRLGRRAVQLLRRGHGRRQGQHQDQLRRDPRRPWSTSRS